MFKKILLITVIILFIVGCNSSNSIFGMWNYYQEGTVQNDVYYKFNKNGTGEYNYYGQIKKFKYEDRGTKLIIEYEDSTISNEFDYSIENNILTIRDSFNKKVIYKRK